MFFSVRKLWNLVFIILFLFLLGNFVYQNYRLKSEVTPEQQQASQIKNEQGKELGQHNNYRNKLRNEHSNNQKFQNSAKDIKKVENPVKEEKKQEIETVSQVELPTLQKRQKKKYKEVPKVLSTTPPAIKVTMKDRVVDFMAQIPHQKSIQVLNNIVPRPKIDLCGVEGIEDLTIYQYTLEKKIQDILATTYKQMRTYKIPNFDTVEFKFHSQNGEDGILLLIFTLIGTTNKKSVEIAGGTGDENNSANLVINHGWQGLMVDGDQNNIDHCKKFFSSLKDSKVIPTEPHCVQKFVDITNTPEMIKEYGFAGDIDLLSIDIDGVDLWILKACLTVTNPRVIVVETQEIWGPNESKSRPYSHDFRAAGIPSMGASIMAFRRVLKNYRMVGCITLGFNAFFIRKDISPEIFPEVPNDVCFRHWRNPQWKNIMTSRRYQGESFSWVDIEDETEPKKSEKSPGSTLLKVQKGEKEKKDE